MKTVLTESSTIRVVADISFVTLIPAKLKNAILAIVPAIQYRNNYVNYWKLNCYMKIIHPTTA